MLAALLAGCSALAELPTDVESSPEVDSAPAETATASSTEASTIQAANTNELTSGPSQSPALTPDRYCYIGTNSTISGAIRLTVDESAQVIGDSLVSIYDDEAGYYSSYAQRFTGKLAGDRAALTVLTWVEYDLQEVEETWLVTPDTLTIDDKVFFAANCNSPAVADNFIGSDGFNGDTLLTELPPAERVEFAPGTQQTTLERSVVRGDRDVYLLGAQGGQQITLALDSLEANAVFELIAPTGTVLTQEAVNNSLILPQTGDYTVIVDGTRGNATYTLDITIE
ncbi:MAG: hypothetical protein AAGF66_17940 [Cyanobacteria bacterium P01_H01_bin.119]